MSISDPGKKVGVVGAGLIGSSWAIVFARAGYDVALYDGNPGAAERARGMIAERTAELERNNLLDDAEETLGRISLAPDLGAALHDAVYVQESTFETLECKRAVFAEIDPLIDATTVVGSSSSAIPASSFTERLKCRSRCLIAHPVNPPYLVRAVELVPAPWTAPETMRWTRTFMARVGQEPVEMNRELEGFILNRLQGALLAEAWDLVAEGYASVADIDRTVAYGLGARWSFMGPFETIDLNAPGGVADYASRYGPFYHRLVESRREHHPWTESLIAKVEAQRRAALSADHLADRARWRDQRLMALALHKRGLANEDKE